MMRGRMKAIMAFALCLFASKGIAQQGPPPVQPQQPQPQPQPQPQQTPPGQNDGNRPPRNPDTEVQEDARRISWYNGDYVPESIPPVTLIDDPVTGFGNEALWTNPAPLPDSGQSDIAGSAEPD